MSGIPGTRRRALGAALMLLIGLASAPQASAASFLFDDFSNTAGLTLNGFANNLDNGIDPSPVLRLAGAAGFTTGSAFTDSAMDVTGFTTSFDFRISGAGGIPDMSGQSGGEGITFVIQAIGPNQLGGGGSGMGYEGITPSVAVELDTWNNDPSSFPSIGDPDSNHLGIDTNGSLQSLVTAAVPGRFDDATLRSVTISYDGTTLTASSGGSMVGLPIDIAALLGTSSAYVGLTAASGGAFGDHDIVSWSFQSVPEPSSLALLGLGVLAVAARRRSG